MAADYTPPLGMGLAGVPPESLRLVRIMGGTWAADSSLKKGNEYLVGIGAVENPMVMREKEKNE